jgi:hypothetical protein
MMHYVHPWRCDALKFIRFQNFLEQHLLVRSAFMMGMQQSKKCEQI